MDTISIGKGIYDIIKDYQYNECQLSERGRFKPGNIFLSEEAAVYVDSSNWAANSMWKSGAIWPNGFEPMTNKLKITYHKGTRQVKLQNFHAMDCSLKRGTCTKLRNDAYFDIGLHYPDLYLLRVAGTEPNYFMQEGDTHHFLLIGKRDSIDFNGESKDPELIKRITDQNPLLVDPSFKKVIPFLESEYTVFQLMTPGYEVTYSNTKIIGHHDGAPLGIDSQKNMIYLMADFNKPDILQIGLQKVKSKWVDLYDLSSPILLKKLSNDSELMGLVNLLKDTKISEVNSPIEDAGCDIIIG